MPSKKTIGSILSLIVVMSLTGCTAIGVSDMTNSNHPDTTQDEWLVVVPVQDNNVPNNATVIDATNESFRDIESLQRALADAEETDEKTTVELSKDDSRQFVKATRDVPRAPNEPGIYVKHDGDVYRVYISGLA